MPKNATLSHSEKVLLFSSSLFVVIVLVVMIWFQVTNANPQVNVPTPALPSHNAYASYVKAYRALKPLTLQIPGNIVPGNSYQLYFDQIEQLLSAGQKPGNKPGLVISAYDYGSHPRMHSIEPSFTEMQALVQTNAPAFNLLREGFRYEYRLPQKRYFLEQFPHFSDFREMANTLNVAGYIKRSTGDWHGAGDAYIDCIQMGISIPHGSPMNGMLVGTAIQAIGRSDLWSTIDHLDATQAKAGAQRMETLLSKQMPFVDTLQEQQWTIQASLLNVFHSPGWRKDLAKDITPYYFGNKPISLMRMAFVSKRQVMENMTHYLNAEITNAKLPYAAPKTAPPLPNDPITRNMVGVFERAYFRDTLCRTQNALLTVSFALRAYYVEHDQYPASLKELTPTYLHAIPADPFALNGTLRYKRTGTSYILYSIGPDGKDDGGQASKDGHRLPPAPRNQPRRPAQITREGSRGDMVAGVNVN